MNNVIIVPQIDFLPFLIPTCVENKIKSKMCFDNKEVAITFNPRYKYCYDVYNSLGDYVTCLTAEGEEMFE